MLRSARPSERDLANASNGSAVQRTSSRVDFCGRISFAVLFSMFLVLMIFFQTHLPALDKTDQLNMPQVVTTDRPDTARGDHLEVNDDVLRTLQYCTLKTAAGSEGDLHDQPRELTLKHLLVTIRHGDRSAIHKMPGSAVSDEIRFGKKYLVKEALLYRSKMMMSFKLKEILEDESRKLSSIGVNNVTASSIREHEKIMRFLSERSLDSLNDSYAFHRGDFNLKQGQLTSRGFMQHINLGKLLRQSYLAFISSNINSSKNLYVRSTKYDRTIQSAAGLLIALLDERLFPAGETVTIFYHPEDADEVMHGTGLRLSSHYVSSAGEEVTEGGCSKAVSLAQSEKESFETSRAVMSRLRSIFGTDVDGRAITDLVDSALPSMCHNIQLPCNAQSSDLTEERAHSHPLSYSYEESAQPTPRAQKDCLSRELLGAMMREADRAFCGRYTGTAGGDQATKLSTYAFMKEIVSRLRTAASLPADSPDAVKLTLLSGHDTVIAPVLASLGLYTNGLCVWPPYASRIVFELWEPSVSSSTSSSPSDDFYVRVLYNGEDRTLSIPACIAEQNVAAVTVTDTDTSRKATVDHSREDPVPGISSYVPASAPVRIRAGMCSLRALEAQVQSMLSPHTSIEAACK